MPLCRVRNISWYPDSRSLLLLTFAGEFDTRPTFWVDTVTGDMKTFRTLTGVATTRGTPAILPDGKRMVLLRRKRSGSSSEDSVQKLDLETMSATTIVQPRTEKDTIGSPSAPRGPWCILATGTAQAPIDYPFCQIPPGKGGLLILACEAD
jgi:hypothetical protein